jgi:hypothetical protein
MIWWVFLCSLVVDCDGVCANADVFFGLGLGLGLGKRERNFIAEIKSFLASLCFVMSSSRCRSPSAIRLNESRIEWSLYSFTTSSSFIFLDDNDDDDDGNRIRGLVVT